MGSLKIQDEGNESVTNEKINEHKDGREDENHYHSESSGTLPGKNDDDVTIELHMGGSEIEPLSTTLKA